MDKKLHETLDAIPEFAGKVFPVVQIRDEGVGDPDIELPALVYAKSGTLENVFLDEPPNTRATSYRLYVYAKIHTELDPYQQAIHGALSDAFNMEAYQQVEDVYAEEEGGIYVRLLFVTIS